MLTTIDGIAAHATIEPEYWTAARQRRQLLTIVDGLLVNIGNDTGVEND